jgi:tetratricopeptide (TPR) repeat protein
MSNVTPGRNEACRCGSGKKFKRCCGAQGGSAEAGEETTLSPTVMDGLIALINDRRHAELECVSRQLLQRQPKVGELWKMLALALWMQGKDALQALEQAVLLLPDDAESQSNLGTALRARGQIDAAVACFRRAIELQPDFADALNNLGSALKDLGQFEQAVGCYRRALALSPDFAVAQCNLGDVLLAQGQFDAAEAACRQALRMNPQLAEAHNNLARVLRLQYRPEDAEASCRRALDLNPRLLSAMIFFSQLLADRGEFAQAETLLRRAITVDPGAADAWAAIPALRKMTRADAEWAAGAQRLATQPLAPRRESELRFAIGKYFDDVGDYASAFENYRRANDLTRAHGIPYDPGAATREFDRLIDFYDRRWMNRPRAHRHESSRPVFVVGMPRSGTTLAEQILAAHPAVFGAGELRYWLTRSETLAALALDASAEDSALGELAQQYLTLLDRQSPDALRVVDKLPANFRSLGLMHTALPQARIIHMRRSPADTCLSIYFQSFPPSYSYANDLGNLAHYYREYSRIMQHWRSVLPADALLEVVYEELVQEPEKWSRRMIEFIGLPWDPRCLDFNTSRRNILTFSRWQARQKISKSSLARWRKYEPFIAPLVALQNSAT